MLAKENLTIVKEGLDALAYNLVESAYDVLDM
jgi:hypothetical protein